MLLSGRSEQMVPVVKVGCMVKTTHAVQLSRDSFLAGLGSRWRLSIDSTLGREEWSSAAAEEDEQGDGGKGCANDGGDDLAFPKLGEGVDAGGLRVVGKVENADGFAEPGGLAVGYV